MTKQTNKLVMAVKRIREDCFDDSDWGKLIDEALDEYEADKAEHKSEDETMLLKNHQETKELMKEENRRKQLEFLKNLSMKSISGARIWARKLIYSGSI